jgi:hypothetical protein
MCLNFCHVLKENIYLKLTALFSCIVVLSVFMQRCSIAEAGTYIELKDGRSVWDIHQKKALQTGLSSKETDKCQQNRQEAHRTDSIDAKDYVHLKPRSSLSDEERVLLQTLKKAIYENMVIEKNRFVFNLDRDSFVKTGIPEKYYDLLMQNIRENNHFADSLSIHNSVLLEQILDDYKKQQASFKIDSVDLN